MARDSHKVPYRGLTIGGQVISTLHRRSRKSTHFNTIRAEHRAHNGETTRPYITASRNRIHEMRDMGNIIPLNNGHMKLSPQARKTYNLVLSDPELSGNKQAKRVNALAGILRNRKISREQSILEVAATVSGSIFSSRSSRNSRLITPDEAVADLPTLDVQPLLPELANDGLGDIAEEPYVPETLAVEMPGPSQQQVARRTIARQGTEVLYGLATPGNSPVKASGSQLALIVGKQDVQMDDALTSRSSPTPSVGSGFYPAALQYGNEPQPDVVAGLENKILILMQQKAALQEKEQYVIRKLSRNGQGTISNIEAVADRAVRQRDELRAENQDLRAVIVGLNSSITDLQDKIANIQDKLDRAQGERIEMTQSKRRWIARMWALAGRVPGELRKKDSEIENMREKLVGMHALLAQEQSTLQAVQGRCAEERKRRMDTEVELTESKTAHAQEIGNGTRPDRN